MREIYKGDILTIEITIDDSVSAQENGTGVGYCRHKVVFDKVNGIIHVCYIDDDKDVMYAYSSDYGLTWTTEMVDNITDYHTCAVDIDHTGVPYIIFAISTGKAGDLFWSKRTGVDTWTVRSEITTVIQKAKNIDCSIGPNGVLQVVFCDSVPMPSVLYHWDAVNGQTAYTKAIECSIAVDENNLAHITYSGMWGGTERKQLVYVNKPYGAAFNPNVPLDIGAGGAYYIYHVYIDVDSLNSPHITYIHNKWPDSGWYGIKHAYIDGIWKIDSVASGGKHRALPTLQIDENGNIHFFYLDYQGNMNGGCLGKVMVTSEIGGVLGSESLLIDAICFNSTGMRNNKAGNGGLMSDKALMYLNGTLQDAIYYGPDAPSITFVKDEIYIQDGDFIRDDDELSNMRDAEFIWD